MLEQMYEIHFNKIAFNERKISIDYNNVILIGPPKSGKTYLIYDYLSNFNESEYLYIDFKDYKNNIDFSLEELEKFIYTHKISVVIYENYDFSLKVPSNVQSVIITTQVNKVIDGFKTLYVEQLDFEEYLLFDVKYQNSSNSFNSFLKFGNLPEIIEYSEVKKPIRNLEVCKLYVDDNTEFEILFLLIKNAGEKKSIFQLFNSLKKEIKISKDRFYKTCEKFEQNRIIYFCEKYNQPKAVKKIYSFNHALLDIVSYKKNFNNLFKNMVYLELNKRYKEVYYLDNIDFYLPNEDEFILAIPFFNSLISSSIISKILPMIEMYSIQTITIVTVSSEQTIFIGELETTIIPFSSWAVSL